VGGKRASFLQILVKLLRRRRARDLAIVAALAALGAAALTDALRDRTTEAARDGRAATAATTDEREASATTAEEAQDGQTPTTTTTDEGEASVLRLPGGAASGLLAFTVPGACELRAIDLRSGRMLHLPRLETSCELAAPRVGTRVAYTTPATYSVTEVAIYSDEDPTTGQTMDLASEIGDVDRMFRAASRKFKDGLADTYWGHRVSGHADDSYDAKILTIALSNDPDVPAKVEQEAGERVGQWLTTYGDDISTLSEDRKAKYAEIRAMARAPEVVTPGLPQAITMPGDPKVPGYKKHLFSDSRGLFRAVAGEWEQHVLGVEFARPRIRRLVQESDWRAACSPRPLQEDRR
jgi:hypothetical protein